MSRVVWLVCLNKEREEEIKIGKYLKNVQRLKLGRLFSSSNSLAREMSVSSLFRISTQACLVL